MIRNLTFGILFLKILFRTRNVFIFVQTFQWTSFFNFRFSSRKSQSQQKLAKKIRYFTIPFHAKILTYFTNLYSLDIKNNMLPKHSQKPFWQTFQQSCFCLVSEKIFALHHFSTPWNCILVGLWKQMSIYF